MRRLLDKEAVIDMLDEDGPVRLQPQYLAFSARLNPSHCRPLRRQEECPAMIPALGFGWLALTVCLICGLANAAEPKGLGDPGQLTALKIEPVVEGQPIAIRSRDGRQQLFVTGVYSSGQLRDHTRIVQYQAEPGDVVPIDPTGYVTPVKDGVATIRATASGNIVTEARVEVTGVANDVPVNFPNQIVPIFTKLGCNTGGCHGKASGQNGFKLSLLGFYPEDDYEYPGQRRPRPPAVPAIPRPKPAAAEAERHDRRTAAASGWTSTATSTG